MPSRYCVSRPVLCKFSIFALTLALAPLGFAQTATGRVLGTITDSQGAAIAGAKVSVVNTATNVVSETVTNSEGYYQVLEMPVGTYKVRDRKSVV